jgi:tetratricopeptide (TPR) repeat protein
LLNASPSRPVTAAAPSRHFPFKWLAIAATAIAVLAVGAFAFLHSRRSGPNDASIQAAVIQRLQAALGPGGVKTECTTCRDPDLFVNVLVQHSAVVLSGVLPAESIDASIQLTRAVDGVSDVSSVLRPPSTPANASAATPPTPKLAARTAQPSGSTGNTGPTHPTTTAQHTGSDSSSMANLSADALRARAFVITGREKMKQANYESARANFEQALNLDPDNEAARSGLAAANRALGDQ